MISKASKYALTAVLYLSKNSSEENKIGIKELAEKLEMPKHFLAKILQDLSRRGYVNSSKGPTGGFYITRENRGNTLLDIIEVVEGKEMFSTCLIGLEPCNSDNPCPIHEKIASFKNGFLKSLQTSKIHDLAPILEKRINKNP